MWPWVVDGNWLALYFTLPTPPFRKKKNRELWYISLTFIGQSEGKEGKENPALSSMYDFKFRWLCQNLAKIPESTLYRQCWSWKYFMWHICICLLGFYVKWIISYNPAEDVAALIYSQGSAPQGGSKQEEILNGHREPALLQSVSNTPPHSKPKGK